MSYLLSTFTGLKYLSGHQDDDWTDRLHYEVTANVLIGLSILVSFKQFGGRPMECMLPDHLPDSWEQYAENYCWAQDTYYLSYEQDLTRAADMRNAHISYYQWVPFYFLLSALSFQVPSQIWRFLCSSSGIRLESLIEQATDPKNVALEARQYATRVVAIYLENALQFQRRLYKRRMVPHRVLRFLNLPYKPFFVTSMYVITKALYVCNVFAQFLLMNFLLQSNPAGGWYGWHVLVQVLNGTQWSTSGFFPRDTLCDLQVRVPGNVQQYSIQCVLSINLFTEKLFVFLWFWYHVLAVITVFSLLYWLIVCLPPYFPRWFIVRQLELADMPFDPIESEELVRKFVGQYLRTDGVFIIHMVNLHTSAIFSSELVAALYKSYVGIEALVKSVDGGAFGKRWPSIETLQRMRSDVTNVIIGEEVRHAPPPTAPFFLDQPDSDKPLPPAQPTGRSISEVVAQARKAPKAIPEDEYRDSADEDAKSGCGESPFTGSAARKRYNAQTSL